MPRTPDRSPRAIFVFWVPLALQWLMMSMEGPFLAAVIARLADPTFNLAAYGVAFAFAILVESPVIMLMSASTALVEDRRSYFKLRNFSGALSFLSTALLILLLIPWVNALVLRSALGLPDDVANLVHGALWILLPWPAAIGYRRFLHGIMIRSGRTRLVAYGTGLRLGTMAATGLLLAYAGLPGAWVGAGALSAGVVVEALAAYFMSRAAVQEVLDRPGGTPSPTRSPEGPPHDPELTVGTGTRRAVGEAGSDGHDAREGTPAHSELDYRQILHFYYPLALTSFISLTSQPILTFFMGRAPAPVESLALFPVVMALYFIFATLGLSYQEAAIALLGRDNRHRKEVSRFAWGLSCAASGMLAFIAFTPLARVWFEGISGLEPELAALAFTPAQIIAVGPALSVLLGLQRALLVQERRTRPITVATALEVTSIAILFPVLGWGLGWMGVTAAMAAFAGGRAVGVLFLAWKAGTGRRRTEQEGDPSVTPN